MAGVMSPVISVCVDEDFISVGSANVLAVDNSLPSMLAPVSLKLGRTSVVCADDETITGGAVSERGSRVASLAALSPRTEFRPLTRSGLFGGGLTVSASASGMLGKGSLWDRALHWEGRPGDGGGEYCTAESTYRGDGSLGSDDSSVNGGIISNGLGES